MANKRIALTEYSVKSLYRSQVLLVAPEVDRQQAPPMDVDAHVDLFLAAVVRER